MLLAEPSLAERDLSSLRLVFAGGEKAELRNLVAGGSHAASAKQALG